VDKISFVDGSRAGGDRVDFSNVQNSVPGRYSMVEIPNTFNRKELNIQGESWHGN
jgi:hypothetical protein